MSDFLGSRTQLQVAVDLMQPGLLFDPKHLGDAIGLVYPALSSGRDHTRIDPPWVGINSTSTTAKPAVASARIAESTV